MPTQSCSVPNCSERAFVRAFLYDLYLTPKNPEVFFEPDKTCLRLCKSHFLENEAKARGVRQPRGVVRYPYTNVHGAQGFTIYQQMPRRKSVTALASGLSATR